MSVKWGAGGADTTRMSVPPPSRAPMAPDPKLVELRRLRRTVQAVVVAVVAVLVIAGLLAMAKSMNHETVTRDCAITATTDADYEACLEG
jgi:hypothetical protein